MIERKCPSCGAEIELNVSECQYCGNPLAVQSQQQVQSDNTYLGNTYADNIDSGNMYSENMYAYLEPYYQEEFKKIRDSNEVYKGKWNWCAFYFSWLWALTKGLWGISLVSLGIIILISAFDPDLKFLEIAVLMFYGVRGNYFYYNLVKNKKQFPQK